MPLIICRKLGETIVVDNHTEITISEIHGKRVKLSITGPRSTIIRRKETVSCIISTENEKNETPTPPLAVP